MGMIDNSICINEEIIKISCDTCETKLVQGVVFEPDSMCFKNNVTRKTLFKIDLVNTINKSSTYLINFPDNDLSIAYRINQDYTVTRVNHLYIEMKSGKRVFLVDEDVESYKNILYSIPKDLVQGLFIKIDGKYIMYDKEVFSKSDRLEKP